MTGLTRSLNRLFGRSRKRDPRLAGASLRDADPVGDLRDRIKQDWAEARYYDDAEKPGWLAPFWGEDSPFLRLFSQLDLTAVVDLACGRGRHAAQIVDRAGHLTLVDINQSNIDACRIRLGRHHNVSYLVNSGGDLAGIADATQTAIFSYDAMVHFEAIDVIAYLREIARVIVPGGRALLHYSNYDRQPESCYSDNPAGRNFFSEAMMRHFANRSGLAVLESRVFTWPLGSPDAAHPTDALVLLEKPRGAGTAKVR